MNCTAECYHMLNAVINYTKCHLAVQSSEVQSSAVQCSPVQCHAVCAVQSSAVQCSPVQCELMHLVNPRAMGISGNIWEYMGISENCWMPWKFRDHQQEEIDTTLFPSITLQQIQLTTRCRQRTEYEGSQKNSYYFPLSKSAPIPIQLYPYQILVCLEAVKLSHLVGLVAFKLWCANDASFT